MSSAVTSMISVAVIGAITAAVVVSSGLLIRSLFPSNHILCYLKKQYPGLDKVDKK